MNPSETSTTDLRPLAAESACSTRWRICSVMRLRDTDWKYTSVARACTKGSPFMFWLGSSDWPAWLRWLTP